MTDIKTYQQILQTCHDHDAQLVAVSKTKSPEEMMTIYNEGHRDFGENRIEEINRKAPLMPDDIRWHLIGPLQSRKVKLMTDNIHLFHALDREKIWRKADAWCKENEMTMSALLQIHIAEEDSKFGFSYDELDQILSSGRHEDFPNIRITGLMGMATNTDDDNQVQQEFHKLKSYFDKLKDNGVFGEAFTQLSIGMSGDYTIAIKEGATILRIGSKIFGPRDGY